MSYSCQKRPTVAPDEREFRRELRKFLRRRTPGPLADAIQKRVTEHHHDQLPLSQLKTALKAAEIKPGEYFLTGNWAVYLHLSEAGFPEVGKRWKDTGVITVHTTDPLSLYQKLGTVCDIQAYTLETNKISIVLGERSMPYQAYVESATRC